MFSVSSGSLAARKRKAKKEEEQVAESGDAPSSAALIRISRDLADLDLSPEMEMKKEDDYNLTFTISPESGFWKGGSFTFRFSYPPRYPFEGPKVVCTDLIYHPNIDMAGAVCVNMLRPWKPTYSTNQVLFALMFLFLHPNPNDPLNQEAAKEMREQPAAFARNVVNALKGVKVNGIQFPKNKGKGPFAQV